MSNLICGPKTGQDRLWFRPVQTSIGLVQTSLAGQHLSVSMLQELQYCSSLAANQAAREVMVLTERASSSCGIDCMEWWQWRCLSDCAAQEAMALAEHASSSHSGVMDRLMCACRGGHARCCAEHALSSCGVDVDRPSDCVVQEAMALAERTSSSHGIDVDGLMRQHSTLGWKEVASSLVTQLAQPPHLAGIEFVHSRQVVCAGHWGGDGDHWGCALAHHAQQCPALLVAVVRLGSWSALFGALWDRFISIDADFDSEYNREIFILIAAMVDALDANY
ncbi:hypothetical protein BJ912DRAFT_932926 [Pholiota molesta]|nr:hypothetical protein BJ912DRAFT_932926 [Pholiota molesta]